jgi:arylsulfatase A-like enzyme
MNGMNNTNGTNKDYVTAGPYQAYLQERGLLDDFVQDMKQREREQPVWHAAGTPLPAEHFHDSYIGQKACDYLRKVTDESPWHLFVSFVGPHDPWDAPAEYAKKYADTTFTAAIPPAGEGKPEWVRRKANIQSAGMSPDDLAQVKQHYSGAVELIDEWIGRMLDIVEQRGLLEQTAIVFCADHGEMLGDHGLFQKSVMYEAALRVPLIVSVPGMSQPMGKTSNALVELIDIHPTLLDLAGVEYLREPLDAKSLMPLIKDTTEQHKRYQISILDHCRMITDGEYKLIENANEGNELYRLEEDPSEQVNRLHDEPEIARRLLAQLKKACI